MKVGLGLRAQLHIIIGTILAISIVAAATLSWRVVGVFYRSYVLEEKGAAIAQALAGPAAKCVVDDRWAELNSYLAAFSIAEQRQGRFGVNVRYAFVLTGQGRLYASSGASHPSFEADGLAREALAASSRQIMTRLGDDERAIRGAALDFAVPLTSGARRVGVLRFGLDLDRARTLYWRTTLGMTLAVFGFLSLVWVGLYVTLRRRILAPLLQLSAAVRRIREGDLTTRLRVMHADELGNVAASLNTLVEKLKTQKWLQVQVTEARSLASDHKELSAAHRELAETIRKLRETQDQLIKNEKHASLGRLVRGVAHEINNPLNTVKNSLTPLRLAFENILAVAKSKVDKGEAGFSQDLIEDLKDIETSCAIIERGVERAVAIVRDLRSFSSLGIQELKPVDLGLVIDNAVEACRTELGPEGRVRVEVNVDPGVGGRLLMLGHQNLLVQLFVNLITNAAQAMPAEGTISIYAARRQEKVHIEVEDDGPGIPKEVLDKVFEPFFTTKEAGKGSGLGLALCLGVVEKHGGEIKVLSERGKGTTVLIDLEATPKEVPVKSLEGA